ncbi:MAG: T6SS effector amidase Tae4 family protein [Pseudomonadota bacterium]
MSKMPNLPFRVLHANFPSSAMVRPEQLSGTLTSKGPQFKGARIESRQKQLSDFLRRRWGQPEKYKGSEAAKKGIGSRRGVVSFFKLLGDTDNQGHIDLVAPNEWGTLLCANSCYWGSVEIWFWPLK